MYYKERYLNTDVHVYVQEKNEHIRLLQHAKLNPLSLIRDEKGRIPNAIINCSYFTSQWVIGRNQGDLRDDTYNESENGTYCDLVFYKDTYKAGYFGCGDYRGKDVLAGFSCATFLILDGKDVAEYSEHIGGAISKFTTKAPQTGVAVLEDNTIVFIVSEGRNSNDVGLTGYQLREFVKKNFNNVKVLAQLDGGGSSEMIVNGSIKNYLSDGHERSMWNGLAFVASEEPIEPEEPEEPKEEKDDETMIKVLDVSSYQPIIDYKAVKDSGIKGVILRCGKTLWGKITPDGDSCFEKHYKGFKAVGMPVGVYYYSASNTLAKAREEAQFTLNVLKGKQFELPVWFDVENNERQGSLSKQALTNIVKEYCQIIESAGYYVGIYASSSWLKTKLDMNQLSNYDVWVAHYGVTKPSYTGSYGMWQYTSSGAVKGIDGKVDLNYCYKDYPTIIKNANLNGFLKPSSDNSKKLEEELAKTKKALEAKEIELLKVEEELSKAQNELSIANDKISKAVEILK